MGEGGVGLLGTHNVADGILKTVLELDAAGPFSEGEVDTDPENSLDQVIDGLDGRASCAAVEEGDLKPRFEVVRLPESLQCWAS